MTKTLQILTPTNRLPERVREENNGFHHLLPRYREGAISFEVFKKDKTGKLNTRVSNEGGREDHGHARKVKATAEMGVRGEGSGVGEKASLRSNDKTQKEARKEEEVKRARLRKRGSRG